MIIIAFDASTTHVGWCILSNGEIERSSCFIPKGKRAEDRLPQIAEFAHILISDYFYGDECVAVAIEESRGNHGNRNTDFVLGRVYGVIEGIAYRCMFPVVGINPQQVKRSGVHKHALRVASQMAGHECGEDEADAIGVALAAWKKIRYVEVTP